jgi:adenylosuccinate lyase
VHAEPITFGLKVANWFAENRRNIARFKDAAQQMAVGKISGAVGNAAHLGVEVEEEICRRLGLTPVAVASQVIQRDRHAQYVSTLAIDRGHAGKNRPRDSPLAAHRSARGRGAFRRQGSAAVRPCRTSAIP